MSDEDYRAGLIVNNAFGYGDIIGERYRRILNDRNCVAVFSQDVIDALPTRAVHKTTVHQDNGLCSQTWSFSHDDLLLLKQILLVTEVLDKSKYLSARPHNTPQTWHCASPGRRLNLNSSLQHSPLYMWRLIEVVSGFVVFGNCSHIPRWIFL